MDIDKCIELSLSFKVHVSDQGSSAVLGKILIA